MRRLVKFLMVGAAGFAVDFAIMWALLTFAHAPPIPARLVAFAIAVAFTYGFNRAFTFSDRPQRGRREWVSYTLASTAAAIVNLAVFALVLHALGARPLAPYIAMPVGVAAGLGVNFFCYNFFVFRAAPTTER